MKHFRFLLILLTTAVVMFPSVQSQTYEISVWGFQIGEVNIHTPTSDSMSVRATSTGIVDIIFPFDNDYITTFDSTTYACTSYRKSVKQGTFEQKLTCVWDESSHEFNYKKYDRVSREEKHHNIFSLFSRVHHTPLSELDTKWFLMEHEGSSFRARFLWADSMNLFVGSDSISSNHFRLDVFPANKKNVKILDQTDYFSRNITHQKGVRQLWVERGVDKHILQASFTLSGIPIKIQMKP